MNIGERSSLNIDLAPDSPPYRGVTISPYKLVVYIQIIKGGPILTRDVGGWFEYLGEKAS